MTELPVTRNAWLWLLAALVAAFLPLLPILPWWMSITGALVVIWRVQVWRQRWQLPGTALKLAICVITVIGLWLHFGGSRGLEPMVTLLVLAVTLKLLEVRRRRDYLLVLLGGFFWVALHGLFSQSLLVALYALVCLCLLLAALLSLQQSPALSQWRSTLWRSCRIILHAVPLMAVMFVVMPRIGSLWSVPTPEKARTGVSDHMSPGDFIQLARSSEPAFRVAFTSRQPNAASMYWRGLTLSAFDGQQWSRGDFYRQSYRRQSARSSQPGAMPQLTTQGEAIEYRIMLEPTQRHWLYTLAAAQVGGGFAVTTDDLVWGTYAPIRQRMEYQVVSHTDFELAKGGLSRVERAYLTRLPDTSNPNARALAQQWFAQAGSPDAYIQQLLNNYRDHFSYTLEPPPMAPNWIDDFILQKQRGFCQHFAGSFVYMARAAGIPARVVVGYQGGEYNAQGHYWLIRQYDAHAWAELWLEGRGWVRFDPTAAVAPERIEQGIATVNPNAGLGEFRQYPGFSVFNRLQQQWDAINYRWQLSIMGYDSSAQLQLLQRWLGDFTPTRLALVLLGVLLILLLPVLVVLWLQQQVVDRHPAIRVYLSLSRWLARRQIVRRDDEPLGDFCTRAAQQLPGIRPELRQFQQLFNLAYYGGQPERLADLRASLRRIKTRSGTRSLD